MKQRTKADWGKLGVELGDEVNVSRISNDSVLHSGSRIFGTKTSIGPGSIVGVEAPVTINNCQLGRNVELKGGYFKGAVFFEGANIGSGAHVRAGTILEEEASAAHTVGLKQTILLPFVTTGSLINFCDVLMAGGTSRKNHSEIGSSYIHFNFTPHQDKATASLLGDVPNGVFLDRNPVFLGGQGGLIGPARIAYGSVIAAGGVCRTDIEKEDQLLISETPKSGIHSYDTGVYKKIDRIVKNNLTYIGNIMALREWYKHVRCLYIRDDFDQAALDGGIRNLDLILTERIKRLDDLAIKMVYSYEWLETNSGSDELIERQKLFADSWPDIQQKISGLTLEADSSFITHFKNKQHKETYTETVKTLEPHIRESGRAWLQSIVDSIEELWS